MYLLTSGESHGEAPLELRSLVGCFRDGAGSRSFALPSICDLQRLRKS